MKFKKILGHILIIAGICIPLQAFTQISIRDMSSAMDYKKYQEEYRSKNKSSKNIKEDFDKYDRSVVEGSGLVDPFVADDYKSDYQIRGWDKDKIFGYLIIPSIDVKQPIRLDASYDHLDKGVAHIYGTSLPIGGKDRRSVIAGHRGWYRGIMLLNLGKVVPSDKVFIDRNGKLLTYEVKDIEIIRPSEWQKLKPIQGKDMLTILSCHPIRPPSPYRMLVNCERVEEVTGDKAGAKSQNVSSDQSYSIVASQKTRSTPVKYVFYTITIVGWLLVLYRLWKLIKELRGYYGQENC